MTTISFPRAISHTSSHTSQNETRNSAKKSVPAHAPGDEVALTLTQAVRVNDPDRIRALLQAKANPNQPDKVGWTPINLAVLKRFWACVRILAVDERTDVNGSLRNWTPLYGTILGKDLASEEIFLRRDARLPYMCKKSALFSQRIRNGTHFLTIYVELGKIPNGLDKEVTNAINACVRALCQSYTAAWMLKREELFSAAFEKQHKLNGDVAQVIIGMLVDVDGELPDDLPVTQRKELVEQNMAGQFLSKGMPIVSELSPQQTTILNAALRRLQACYRQALKARKSLERFDELFGGKGDPSVTGLSSDDLQKMFSQGSAQKS